MVKKKSDSSDVKLLEVGAKLKELRVAKGYTSYETFAFDHELNRVQYWRMEKGQNFTLKSLLKVLEIHNISMEEFFKNL